VARLCVATGKPAGEILTWSRRERIFQLAAMQVMEESGVGDITTNALTEWMLRTGQLTEKKSKSK